ncbi:30S ribosomal protein S6e [Candidatus Lokiarchaeum ossiferum]|uniref:Small ribosomal subunit protein eS6 n=1 Tax=Candidatus Lokiarchaeum ossiferum TaxID=2951803 RepID=A0ABY6HRG8_9ARCH|nr:30S ribosomal protein S6e [Candidatus Lokiarchaeum sp. B-35]
MADEGQFKINVSAGKDAPEEFRGQTKVITLEENKFTLVGKIVGETFNGALIGLPGYELKITGGSDRGGIPIRKDVHGPTKKRILLSKGPCYVPKKHGEKRRKIVRGNEITDDMTQVNTIVVKYGKEKLFKAKGEEEKAE